MWLISRMLRGSTRSPTRIINIVHQYWANFPQFLIRILGKEYDGTIAMKTTYHENQADSATKLSRPPPVVHPVTEPEYDTDQISRRATQVTGVLEHILHDTDEHKRPPAGSFLKYPPIP